MLQRRNLCLGVSLAILLVITQKGFAQEPMSFLTNEQGIAGVAPDATLAIARVVATYHENRQEKDEQEFWVDVDFYGVYHRGILYDDLADAIWWATDTADADIINMSIILIPPFPIEGAAIQTAINHAVDNHVVVVAASGNNGYRDGTSLPIPARLNNVIAVGATDTANQVLPKSNWHSTQLDLVAPGFRIWATMPYSATPMDTGFASDAHLNHVDNEHMQAGGLSWYYTPKLDGTSGAAAHVSGTAALLRSYIPDLDHSCIESVLEGSAEITEDPDWDGEGRINAYDALQSLYVPNVQVTLEELQLKASGGGENKFVKITWGEYTTLTITKYRIWKKVDSGSWSLWQANLPLTPRNKHDTDVSPGHTYHYYVEGADGNDASHPIRGKSPPKSVNYPEGGGPPDPSPPIKGEEEELPKELELKPNYPNPFNPSTQIKFGLPSNTHVRLQIMNIRGQTVRVLVDDDKSAGWHTVMWDGKNESGRDVASGIYLYMIEADNKKILKKMTLIR